MSGLRAALLLTFFAGLGAAELHGQELRLKREVPAVAWSGCPAAPAARPATPDDRAEAERLAAAATQASILGEAREAADLLDRAVALDPGSASLAYRLARAEHELDRLDRAVAAYCRYLALAPDAHDAADIRTMVAELARPSGFAVPAAAAAAFEAGVAHYEAGRLEAADSAFGRAAAAAGEWPDPVYNRGLVRLELDRADAAAEDLRRYLEMNPRAPEFGAVLDVLGALRGVAPAPYNPTGALAAGLVVPGLGHFLTDRTRTGALVLAGAGAAVAAGLAVQRVSVECLAPAPDGVCPPDQILREQRDRPYAMHGIGAALAIGVWGAIDAYRGARRGNDRAAELLRIGTGPRGATVVAMPHLSQGRNTIRVELLRLRF